MLTPQQVSLAPQKVAFQQMSATFSWAAPQGGSSSRSRRQILREFCRHPRRWFPTCGTSANLSSIQWTTVTTSPMRSESQPREWESSFQFVLFWHSTRKSLVSSSHNMSDAKCEGLPHTEWCSASQIPTGCPTIQSWLPVVIRFYKLRAQCHKIAPISDTKYKSQIVTYLTNWWKITVPTIPSTGLIIC